MNYHVVVIGSTETEDRSNMVASLDPFRRQFQSVIAQQRIQTYLNEKLSARRTTDSDLCKPAAIVDKDW